MAGWGRWIAVPAAAVLLACGSSGFQGLGGLSGADDSGPVDQPCKPIPCAFRRAACGEVPDGCNGTLLCGTCGPGQTCGGGGQPNVCGVPSDTGMLKWLNTWQRPVVAVSSNHAGSVAALLGDDSAKMLVRHDAS